MLRGFALSAKLISPVIAHSADTLYPAVEVQDAQNKNQYRRFLLECLRDTLLPLPTENDTRLYAAADADTALRQCRCR